MHRSSPERPSPAVYKDRLRQLRAQMQLSDVQGYLLPRADEHQNEYVPACAERLAWLSGFTGSAGTALVLTDAAALFVDGRYTQQSQTQIDLSEWTSLPLEGPIRETWLSTHLSKDLQIGYDPWLHTSAQIERWQKICDVYGAKLVPIASNLVDACWIDRPASPHTPCQIHPLAYTGECAEDKIARLRATDAYKTADTLLISAPDSIAWLLNMRGQDVPHTPITLAYLLVPYEARPTLFIDMVKIHGLVVHSYLEEIVDIAPASELGDHLKQLGQEKKRILGDQATLSVALQKLIIEAGGTCDLGLNPISPLKAIKNETELAGIRHAHQRDGVAMVRFLAWLETHWEDGSLTEQQADAQLMAFRQEVALFKDISFDTISASGPHAALPHYHATNETDIPIGEGIYLVDSGGQYEDGTTDITRTCCRGIPSPEMRDKYTRVLKGHIAIATAIFPKNTTGAQLDTLARFNLWQVGVDYDHGTGHGVGAFLSVHEGPQNISKRGHVALEKGMVLSNEPGYYKPGHWGIRLENLCCVIGVDAPHAEHEMFGFETLSLCPFEAKLIDFSLLSEHEYKWLKAYHAKVLETLGHLLPEVETRWLERKVQAIMQPENTE